MFNAQDLNGLYRYAFSLSAHEADAYDLLHNALDKFLRTSTTTENLKAYLRKMIRNAYIDQIRHAKAAPMVSFEDTGKPIGISEYSLETPLFQTEISPLFGQHYSRPREKFCISGL